MKIDKEICHPTHPSHKLRLEYTEVPFNCDGCKEAGIGLKYKCMQCEFDLHKVCAVGPPTITHLFYKKCDFRLYHRPTGIVTRICDACRDDVIGFVYHCDRCGFDLHPCCANLPRILDDGEHNLHLSLKLSSPCYQCGVKGAGWSYRSDCKSYNLHVSCAKQLLVESWQAISFNVDRNKVRDMQTRIPTLKGKVQNYPKRKETKGKKYSKIASGAISVVVSALLGDPTAIIAAVVGGLMSK
ncbi:hypothetical protein ACHQM5_015770 [Ranunculus cassubicifolius]